MLIQRDTQESSFGVLLILLLNLSFGDFFFVVRLFFIFLVLVFLLSSFWICFLQKVELGFHKIHLHLIIFHHFCCKKFREFTLL